MKIKEHTRNQKRMYRIHKQEEKIQELELLVGKLQQENDKLKEQQKEFIKWLEDEIQQQETVIAKNQEKSYFLIYDNAKEVLKLSSQKAYIRRIILEVILQKYREIIGVSDEKK